ncbi:MAG: hypothetical protein K0S78_3560 [Thermomicrobiales bacterium]|jgi:hypothetical protein|nr:hypothetical protein [Thermomicrobiales bacterium]
MGDTPRCRGGEVHVMLNVAKHLGRGKRMLP